MIYSSIPDKTTVESKAELQEFNEVKTLLSRHGYGIIYYGRDGITFYKATDAKNKMVPTSSRFFFSRKDFGVFVEVIRKLDTSIKELNEHIVRLTQPRH